MRLVRRSLPVAVLLLLLVPALAVAGQQRKKKNQGTDVRALFNAGSYSEVLDAVDDGSAPPEDLYLAARSADAMNRDSRAAALYERLASRSESVWAHVGASALAIVSDEYDDAVSEAAAAVEAAPDTALAHFQHGQALAFKRDFAAAAEAFRRVLEIDPDFAYAHYYAGMSFYRNKEIGSMTNHLQRFLDLAPEAPERTQVESIMRSVQG